MESIQLLRAYARCTMLITWAAALPACSKDTIFHGGGSHSKDSRSEANASVQESEQNTSQDQVADSGPVSGSQVIPPSALNPTDTLPPLATSGTYALSFPSGSADSLPSASFVSPLSLYLVLDVTGSMDDEIDNVRNNLNSLVNNLGASQFSVRIGVVTFKDNIYSHVPLTNDFAGIISHLDGLEVGDGGGENEFALGALNLAFQSLRTSETRADAVRAVLMVTDYPGHMNGDDDNPNCAVNSSVGEINAFGVFKNLFRFFHSTNPGADDDHDCEGQFATAHQQMEALRTSSGVAGGALGWPFGGAAFASSLASGLTRAKPNKPLQCLAAKITLVVDGKMLIANQSLDLLQVKSSGSTAQFLANLPYDAYVQAQGKSAQLDIEEHCFDSAAYQSNDFSSVLKVKNSVQNITLQ